MPTQIFSKDPAILYFNTFISPKICDQIIAKYDSLRLKKSKSSGPSGYRKSQSIEIRKGMYGFDIIDKLLNENLGISIEEFEPPLLQKYSFGDEYPDHFDAYDPSNFKINSVQRKNTLIFYLNDDFTGGQTTFSQLDITINPIKGGMLIFENCLRDTNFIHPLSAHSGKRILKGKKWIITLWSQNKHCINLNKYL